MTNNSNGSGSGQIDGGGGGGSYYYNHYYGQDEGCVGPAAAGAAAGDFQYHRQQQQPPAGLSLASRLSQQALSEIKDRYVCGAVCVRCVCVCERVCCGGATLSTCLCTV